MLIPAKAKACWKGSRLFWRTNRRQRKNPDSSSNGMTMAHSNGTWWVINSSVRFLSDHQFLNGFVHVSLLALTVLLPILFIPGSKVGHRGSLLISRDCCHADDTHVGHVLDVGSCELNCKNSLVTNQNLLFHCWVLNEGYRITNSLYCTSKVILLLVIFGFK